MRFVLWPLFAMRAFVCRWVGASAFVAARCSSFPHYLPRSGHIYGSDAPLYVFDAALCARMLWPVLLPPGCGVPVPRLGSRAFLSSRGFDGGDCKVLPVS